MSLPQRRPWLPVFAWCVTGFNMLVIAWGALVRATGSGAGCGSHWPQCNGSLLPDLARIETAIEFGHRVSSVLAGLLVIILVLWVMRSNLNRLTRLSSWSSLAFIILEGILGALLVRLELVADNTSTLRAGVVALHLVNTLMLLASLGLTAFASGRVKPVSLTRRPTRVVTWLLGIGLVAMALLSAMGAVTALGDTLFPATSLSTGFSSDLDPAASFLVRLRIIHPLLAILTSAYLISVNRYLTQLYTDASIKRIVNVIYLLVGTQLIAGVVNVSLLAPLWMQVVHLILADSLWIAIVIVTTEIVWQPPVAAR